MVPRISILLVLCLAVLTAPVGAAERSPQVVDECGDATTHAELNGERVALEDNAPHLDIREAGVAGAYGPTGDLDGVIGWVTVCGEVSAIDGGYAVGWSYGDGCFGLLGWSLAYRPSRGAEGPGVHGGSHISSNPEGFLREDCYRPQEHPLDNNVETAYHVVLPAEAATFDGDTVTFTVSALDLPEAAAARLAPGTDWARVSAVAMDQGPSLWGFYRDTEGNDGEVNVRADFARGGDSYVVGADA